MDIRPSAAFLSCQDEIRRSPPLPNVMRARRRVGLPPNTHHTTSHSPQVSSTQKKNPSHSRALPVKRVVSTMQSATEWLIVHLVRRMWLSRAPISTTNPNWQNSRRLAVDWIRHQKRWPRSSPTWCSVAKIVPRSICSTSLVTVQDSRHLTRDGRHRGHVPPPRVPGVLVGKTAKADSLAQQLRLDLNIVKRDACAAGDSAKHPTVLIIVSTDPPMTAGGHTWINTLLDTACLQNVVWRSRRTVANGRTGSDHRQTTWIGC